MEPVKKKVKTRKVHRCYLCRNYFPKGTEMFCETEYFDNYATIYSCTDCEERLSKTVPDDNLII